MNDKPKKTIYDMVFSEPEDIETGFFNGWYTKQKKCICDDVIYKGMDNLTEPIDRITLSIRDQIIDFVSKGN